MKVVIVGAGPCGLGAAWRAEEIIRQGNQFNYKRKGLINVSAIS